MKFLLNCFCVTGCVLGIGFLSGKELVVFFGDANPLYVSLCFFVLFFAVTLLFFYVGKKTGVVDLPSLDKKLFGKRCKLFDFVFVCTCFLVCAVMLAGIQTLWTKTLGSNFCFSLLVALICASSLCFGVEYIQKFGWVFVLVSVLMLVVTCLDSFDCGVEKDFGFDDVFRVAKYVCFNCMLGASVFLTCANKLSKGQIKLVAVVSALTIAFLMFLILSVSANEGGDMPMLSVADRRGLFLPYAISMTCGVILSLTSCSYTVTRWVQTKTNDRFVSIAIVYTCAYVVSLFGFGQMLAFMLPVSSAFALLFVFCVLTKLCKNKGNG